MSFLLVLTALLAIVSASLNWSAVIWRIRILEYVFKPLVMGCLLFIVIVVFQAADTHLRFWFGIALFFSFIGDVFLMLPNQKWFTRGLLSFLLTHIAYIIAFRVWTAPGAVWFLWLLIAVLATMILPQLMRKLKAGDEYFMRGPVLVYGLVLSTMLFSTWGTVFHPQWSPLASGFASVGGSLFFLSDVLLAWERYVDDRRGYNIAVIVTYHLAQFCLMTALAAYPSH